MTKSYALIPEEYITLQKALMFSVVTNFPTTKVLESHLITDASGQESEIYTEWIQFRWVESDDNGFTTEQLTCINECKNKFNAEHTTQIDFEVVGDTDFARNFDSGKKLQLV
ncbi:hypothetical protein FVR03_16760 [Pontibacter qinzhouensis]|uniref:Uncharacterized protein n=1 Tax=Pontibacter qinzhouensis TaxID=2603253 RepID=A0A5C8JIL5_9BACT|nr:hypothetical protein [Pontibacter qinzhouensis]TXK36793.1 hypothetical protein FVR03_16760 [Pontibacter qinzhouensis]